ncbi:MAG: hypothetical protein Ct9H300mP1_16690 [Planctomycetaceae bacterium]|nr:MAG: hypothetical protein Ct9H300mP1_16690 [Planctomycetaceae bacterium]
MQAVQLTVTPPSYTMLQTTTAAGDTGEVAALAGSRVEVAVTASKDLRSARLVTESGQEFALTGSGSDWKTDFILKVPEARIEGGSLSRSLVAPDRYQLVLEDTLGHANDDPVWRSIAAVPDQPPTVAIPRPGTDRQVAPEATVVLKVAAKDDYGVARVRVLYRVNDDETVRVLTGFEPAAGAENEPIVAEFEWKLGEHEIRGETWSATGPRRSIATRSPGPARRVRNGSPSSCLLPSRKKPRWRCSWRTSRNCSKV